MPVKATLVFNTSGVIHRVVILVRSVLIWIDPALGVATGAPDAPPAAAPAAASRTRASPPRVDRNALRLQLQEIGIRILFILPILTVHEWIAETELVVFIPGFRVDTCP